MSRQLTGGRLVLASHNPGKLREIGALIRPFGFEALGAGELGLPEPEETGETFAANARLKAKAAAQGSSLPALADDSGLAVDALGGAPGIHSARWAETGSGRDFDCAMQRIWQALEARQAPEPRRAAFVCALCLSWPDGEDAIFEGRVEGMLVWPPRGQNGFGYDPMFVPKGGDLTFGEMVPADKHAISHRALAFRQMVEACFPED